MVQYTNSFETDKGSVRYPPMEGILLKSLKVSSDATVDPSGQSSQMQPNIRTKRDALEKST